MEPKQTSFEEVRDALSRLDIRAESRLQKETLLTVARLIVTDEAAADELEALVFPTRAPGAVEFYERLHLVERRLGFSEAAATLTGEIGTRKLQRIPDSERINILRCLPSAQKLDFFGALRMLPVFVERMTLPAEFLLSWLMDIRIRIGNDMAQGAYWRSLEVWALKHPATAFEGLRLLCAQNLDLSRS